MRATTMRYGISMAWITLAAVVVAGCGGGSGGGANGGGPPALSEHALVQFESCDDLRDAIVEDARQKLSLQAERLRADGFIAIPGPGVEPQPAPTASPGGGSFEGPGATPRDFTDTNVQVPGVDEADVVETDGTRLYLLRGNELVILDAWPPETTALRERVAIEGTPVGMFVAGGRALVVSSVFDQGELGGADQCHVIGPAFPAFEGQFVDIACGTPFTKVTLLDLATDEPRIAREIYLEGNYVSARRHGNVARVVVQRDWGLPASVPEPWPVILADGRPRTFEQHVQRVDEWEHEAAAALEASTLAQWLPARRDREGGAVIAKAPDCGDVHVPPPALTGDGTTRIFAFDMTDDDGAARDTIVLGGTSSTFASADTLVLAQPDWSWFESEEPTDRTALHVFTLPRDSLETTYRASGFVPGVPLSQFAFDAQEGTIRIATTVSPRPVFPVRTTTASRITTVRVDGNELALVGTTGDLAPGERIVAVRFLGLRAYLVTLRQVDPLFVVDLTDPAHPVVLGEVELPGFSEYLHPLGDGHLLTIGVDADMFGFSRGVALRIFDVTDPAAPRLTHIHTLPGNGWSPAQANHLVFTFGPRRGLLALPYSRFDEEARSSLVLIAVDADTGFAVRGEIDHQSLANGACSVFDACSGFVEMQRGIFIDDWIYSISSAGVLVNTVDDLAPVSSVLLPQPPTPTPEPLPAPLPTAVI